VQKHDSDQSVDHRRYVGTVTIDGVNYFGDALLAASGETHIYIGGPYIDDGTIQLGSREGSIDFVSPARTPSTAGARRGRLISPLGQLLRCVCPFERPGRAIRRGSCAFRSRWHGSDDRRGRARIFPGIALLLHGQRNICAARRRRVQCLGSRNVHRELRLPVQSVQRGLSWIGDLEFEQLVVPEWLERDSIEVGSGPFS
jgi:hypothetical protein